MFQNMQIATTPSPSQSMIAPITGQGNKGLVRAEIKGGVRELVACKDGDGKIGLRLRHINSVSHLSTNSFKIIFKKSQKEFKNV